MSYIATTISQSRKLIELGLNPETADMVWVRYAAGGYRLEVLHRELFERIMETDIPAWSLSALLEVIPNNDYWDIYLYQAQEGKWQSEWNDCEISKGESKCFIADTPIAAAYEMVCWLLEQGLIKKGGER